MNYERYTLKLGLSKTVSNYEVDVGSRAGALIRCDRLHGIVLRLDDHIPELEEWDNELIWGPDEFAELPDEPADARFFLRGFLAAITSERLPDGPAAEPMRWRVADALAMIKKGVDALYGCYEDADADELFANAPYCLGSVLPMSVDEWSVVLEHTMRALRHESQCCASTLEEFGETIRCAKCHRAEG